MDTTTTTNKSTLFKSKDNPDYVAHEGVGRKPGPQRKHDWVEIKQEYCKGYVVRDPETNVKRHLFPSLKELSEKHGCHYQYIRTKSSNENWPLERNVFLLKVKERRESEHIRDLLNESSTFDAVHLTKIKQIHKLIDYSLAPYLDILEGRNNPDGIETLTDEEGPPPISLKELDSMINILGKCHSLARNILGEPINAEDIREEMVQMQKTGNKDLDADSRKRRIKKLSEKRSGRDNELSELVENQKAIMNQIKGL